MDNLISLIPIIISLGALIISFWKLEITKRAEKTAIANNEISIRTMITSARNRTDDLTIEYNRLEFVDGKSEEAKKVFEKSIFSSIENMLNVYEKACSLYLDNKVDKKRFRKDYKIDIRKLAENKNISERYLSKKINDFGSINRVIKEWFDTESDNY